MWHPSKVKGILNIGDIMIYLFISGLILLGVVGIISALVDLRGESMIKDSKDDRI